MSQTEQHEFQAEIQQLLDIVIHSLYTDKEIFVRELISNAADACEKLRFHQASGEPVHDADTELKIGIATGKEARTLTITDTGVGMTRTELVENLGTIARSGSKAFLQAMASGDQKPDANLIGQFGVGFYSAFMAADEVEVFSRSWREGEPGWKWTSKGSGSFTIEEAADLPRGTRVVVHLKEDQASFAEESTVQGLVRKYSNFVPLPIELNDNRLNTVQALWARGKSEIKEEEYTEFYHYIGHDQEDPYYRLHFTADAPLAIQALLFVPRQNFETMGMGKTESEVNLYCRKVLIQEKAKHLFPDWLRFLRGVVDSEDLPLNISRESMQDSALLHKINNVLTKRFLRHLQEQADKDPDRYTDFYGSFHRFLKEGVVTDFTHQKELAPLLRYESSATEAGKTTSLKDYLTRMPEDQKEIYYIQAANREQAEASPYYEVFRSRKFEVLFLTDPWDEFVMDHLGSFEEKPLKAAEKADLNVEDHGPDDAPLDEEQAKALAGWMKECLGDRVEEVKSSGRLVDSPAVVVDADPALTAGMRRMMKAMRQDASVVKYHFEINPRHPLVKQLAGAREQNAEVAALVVEQLYDNARIAAGLLENPRSMVDRMNNLLGRVLGDSKPQEK